MIACRIFVQGQVQRVFFREWTVGRARELGVTGWVRNRHDGRVAVLAIGDEDQVDRMVAALRIGSPASRVDGVEIEEAEIEQLDGFSRRQAA